MNLRPSQQPNFYSHGIENKYGSLLQVFVQHNLSLKSEVIWVDFQMVYEILIWVNLFWKSKSAENPVYIP